MTIGRRSVMIQTHTGRTVRRIHHGGVPGFGDAVRVTSSLRDGAVPAAQRARVRPRQGNRSAAR
jgi:hypothetical protein